MMAKPRCKWRARRITWCRKYHKFCDAPREYETCPGYEPTERHRETITFAKVRRNISLLREQVFPEGTKYRFVIRTLWGPDSYDVIAKDTTEASVKLSKKLRMTEAELASILDEVWEYKMGQWVKIFPAEIKGWPEAFPETLRLKPLFDIQDSLIEHKFPHEKAKIIDTIISHAGDIYREMTHAYPHYGYIGEKWEKLSVYCVRPPLSWLQEGDWEEIREQLQDTSYKVQRDQYLSNLQRLREETTKMPMDPKRKAVMTESLDMINALIFWFESQDPYAPPRQQLDRLTDAIANYFPREFYRGVQTPPEGWLVKPEWMSQEEWLKMTPCAVCGRRGWDEWAVSDEEWKRYVPLEYQDKEICRVCYERFKRIRGVKHYTTFSERMTLPSSVKIV